MNHFGKLLRLVGGLVVILSASHLNAAPPTLIEPCDECDRAAIWDTETAICESENGPGWCAFIQQCYKQYNSVTQEWEYYYTYGDCEDSGGQFCVNPYFCS